MNSFPSVVTIVWQGLLVCLLVAPGLLPTAAAPPAHTGGQVTNIGSWTRDQRKTGRPEELWLFYQHGVVDHFAQTFRFADLLGPDQDADKWLDMGQAIDTPYKASTQAAVRCRRSDKIELARPIPMPMDVVRGKRVRIFFWMKGNDVGARNNTWHCPDVAVIAKDADGKTLYDSDSHLKSQRTFPWHCFYTDRFVPHEAAGLHLRLFNKFHGTAWFSTPSWEIVDESNTYSNDEKQDPHTGSLSKNPLHEALAYHLGCGYGGKYVWRFVLGEKIGMKGHTHDITTKEGLRAYYFEKAKHHPDEMNHAVLHLQSMYRSGMSRKLLPPMDEDWLQCLAQIIIDDQDPETGYWHDGTDLSLGLTFHLCDMHFRYYAIPRPDRPDRIYAGMDLGLKRVPRAEQIIRTTLMMQSTYVDDNGVKKRAAWNTAAYRYTTEPDASPQNCYLGTTWDAIYLLRLAARYVDEPLQQEVYEAVKDAFRYVLEFMVYENGTFRQRDTDEHPTKASYMSHILQDSSWLERRIVPDMPRPKVALAPSGDDLRLTWRAPAEAHNSLRVYAAPPDLDPEEVNESHLVGIIHKTGTKVHEMDPFIAVWHIRRGTARRWGGSADLPPPTDWRGKKYLPWKLRMITFPLAQSDQLKPLTLPTERAGDKTIYVSAANWYGEESPLTPCALNSGDRK